MRAPTPARTLGELLERAPAASDPQTWLDDDFEPEQTKRCALCKTEKPASQFGLDRNEPDGFNRRCRACLLER
ncbi:MAG TPA: hypothetical protein VK488_06050 [Gaiellaceae bacterium]|nr:hypothetical protein [Gaiellaceae bacterium]